MIEAQNLSRRYGDFTAVDRISFSVNDGEIVGFLGPNGAGKTTAIRMVTGFLPPTSGRVRVAGRNLFEDPVEARREIGYLPENVALYPEMRVGEYLSYRARLEGVSSAVSRESIPETLSDCLLDDVEGQIIGTLSKGYKQRVGLAAAILHRPKVLVLDEPTVGLDPKQIIAIRELIRKLGRQRTLLLSTHILPEVEVLCDRVMIIDKGRIVAEGTPESLRERWKGDAELRVELKDDPPGAKDVLAALQSVSRVDVDGSALRLRCAPGSDPREEVFRLAVAQGWVLLELAERRASLEDVFVRLTTRDSGGDATAAEQNDEEVQG